MECLLSVNASALSVKQWEVSYVNPYLPMAFIPTADYHQLVKGDASKFNFLKDKQIQHEIFAGHNQNEGTFFLLYQYFDRFMDEHKLFTHNKDGSSIVFDNKFVKDRLLESLRTKDFTEEKLSGEEKIENDFWYNQYVGCLNDLYTANGKC